MPMDGGVEFSYAPELYTPPSPHLWNVNPKSLAWKLSGPPPAATQHSFVTPAFRCADAFTSSRPPVAQHSKPPSAAAAAEAEASTTYTPASTSRANAVLGLDVAGYTSVVTRTPISPSGYAVPVQHMLPPPPHHHQQQQQQTASASGSIHMHGDPQLLSDSYAQPAAYFPDPSSSRTQSQPGAPAAAAAAALAALAGSHLRSTSAHVAGASAAGGYAQQYAAKNYTPPPLTSSSSSSSSSSRGSMLLWNIRQPPQQQAAGTPSSTVAVAGRRTVTAGHAGQLQAASAPGLVPDNHSSSAGSSSRPSSQESSPGLMKLKQLSTARLVRRLRTPPTAIAGSSGGGFGAGPAATAAAAGPGSTLQGNPAAGRRAAPVQVPRQQQQQPAQRQQQRQSQNTGSMARPANPPSYRRSSSNNSSSHREVLPVPAQAQPASRHANSTSGSGPEGFISRMMHGFSSSHAPAQAPQLPAGAEYVEVDRQPCPSCGRCFAPPALQQHMRICDKVFGQKRKVFDVKSQRLYGTGAAAAARMRSNSAGGSNPGQRQQARGDPHDKRPAVSATQAKRSKWQQQSEQLRAAMRSTRPQASGFGWGGATSQMQDDPPEDNRVPCPHCGRRFAELVAERHIPKCADVIAKPGRLKAAGGRAAYMRNNSGGR